MDDRNYHLADDGVWRPLAPIRHRDDQYSESGFSLLQRMQERHFWYRGRHRFLLEAFNRQFPIQSAQLSAIDLGGGTGGWLAYLHRCGASRFSQLALGDSSPVALEMARVALPAGALRYQVDLMNLGWEARWDVEFLLDVIEHLPEDSGALRQAGVALKRGGLLFVTVPALMSFWSYNDEAASHLRRYSRGDFARLAEECDLELLDCRYFMFLLSPLYWIARKRPRRVPKTPREMQQEIEREHRVPPELANALLAAIFCAETPIGHKVHFPWGTSLLAVLRKP